MLAFTRDQFLVVFAEYNYQAAVWPPQFVAYALGLAMVLLLFYPSAAMRRTLSAALALMWLWTGVAYHWLHFAAINPVAIGFGTLFVLQGLGFLQAAVTGRGPGYAPVRGASGVLGWSLVGYSTLVLKTWIRFSDAEAVRTGDGLFSRCSGNPALPRWLGSPLLHLFLTADGENDKYARQVRSSAGIAVFASERNHPRRWVEAGRAFERFALQAAAMGVRTAHLNQPVEVPALRRELAEWLGIGGWRPHLVIRFGRGPAMPRSLRRPVDAVLPPPDVV